MADLASTFDLGEYFTDAECVPVIYTETIAAGDVLKVTGQEGNILKVAKQTSTTDARFVAIRPGKNGEKKDALLKGKVKVTFHAGTTPGKRCVALNGKIADTGTNSASPDCGFIISDGAAANDTGLIYFSGVGA